MGQLQLAEQNVSKAIDLGTKINSQQIADFTLHYNFDKSRRG
jgi:hypothetical protein